MQFTPTQKHVAAWLLIALLVALALWSLGRVLTPFIVAAVLAYALTPLVDRLDGLGRGRLPRFVAVAIVELLLIVTLVLLMLMVVPVLANEIPLIREQLPFDPQNSGGVHQQPARQDQRAGGQGGATGSHRPGR